MAFDPFNIDVLLVDKDAAMRAKIGMALRTRNIRNIYEAGSAEAALEAIREYEIDLIIIERDLPDQSGEMLVRTIRNANAAYKDVPVVMLAARGDDLSISSIRDSGINEILLAPFTVEWLMSLLSYVMINKRDFISVDSYKGPDRRRVFSQSYAGEERRIKPDNAKHIGERKQAAVTDPDIQNWPKKEAGREMLSILFAHYLTHYKVVENQLHFAQLATRAGIENQEDAAEQAASQIVGLRGYDNLWEEIIALFRKGGVSENELFKIEKIIQNMPRDIRKLFDDLSGSDNDYNQLHRSLDTESYNRAKVVTRELEKLPNPMSGLATQDYAIKEPEDTIQDIDEQGDQRDKEHSVSVINLDPETGLYKTT